MEITADLKNLYPHLSHHLVKPKYFPFNQNYSLNQILSFTNERMRIYEKKTLGLKPPYTNDPILNKYRFCNIYRELDKQTIYFHTLLKPYVKDFPLWLLNMLFCRYICKPETIEKVGLLNFDKENNEKVYKRLTSLPSPKYGNAYIFPISIIQRSEYNTREKFFCYYLPLIIPEISKIIETFDNISVVDALDRILPTFGYNFKFHWTEVLIDTAYQYPQYIDLFKKFPIGLGSMPTMKMINPDKDPEEACLDLVHSVPENFEYLTLDGKPIYLSTENWEGIGCEYRKYTNLKNGNGRKRKYQA